jgi:hypothetical protein
MQSVAADLDIDAFLAPLDIARETGREPFVSCRAGHFPPAESELDISHQTRSGSIWNFEELFDLGIAIG